MRRIGVMLASVVMLATTSGLSTIGIGAAGAQGRCNPGPGTNEASCGGLLVDGDGTFGGAIYKCKISNCDSSGAGGGGSNAVSSLPGGQNVHQGSLCFNGPGVMDYYGTIAHLCEV